MDRALKGVQRRVALGAMLSIIPRDHQWERACNEVQSVFDKHIEPAIAERLESPVSLNAMSQQEETSTKVHSVLHELIDHSRDPHYIRDQLLSIFLPLHNASPIGIGDLFFQMSRAPGVFAKLRAEVMEFGEVALTFEVLKSMKYLQCVIKES